MTLTIFKMLGKVDFLIFCSVLTLAATVYVVKEECPSNEEYQLCGSACPFNCTAAEGPVTCSEDCVEGCFCKAGYLLHENGTCVSAEFCTGGANSVCQPNEEFLSCGTACPLTCSQLEQPANCGLACSMGCFCKAGYVRDETSKQCITVDQCPKEQCFNQNEVYDLCSAACEPTCQDPEPLCPQICSGGCVCASGLLRDDQGECVSVDKCPVTNSTDPGLIGKYLNVINRILHLGTV